MKLLRLLKKYFYKYFDSSQKSHPDSQKKTQVKRKNKKQSASKKKAKAWHLDLFQVPEKPGKKRFHDFHLPLSLMQSICELGFQYCTPIQEEILTHALQGRDAVGKAHTGTGKTAAFLITTIKILLEITPPKKRYLGEPRAVIIAPTRELALQIGTDAAKLAKYTSLNITLLIGGIDLNKQQEELNKKNNFLDIVIATPGRLLDFLSKEQIYLDLVEIMILDEADRMLDMGFIPQVKRILSATPRPGDRQTLFFSATFSHSILQLIKQWTWNPAQAILEEENAVIETIEQKIYLVSAEEKYKILCNIIRLNKNQRMIIFVNRRHETKNLYEALKKDGFLSSYLSGDLPQKKRLLTLDNFKKGKISILIATDVAGRGLHINDVRYVINYNLPENSEDYIHRVGRTGRAGTEGTSISFACENDAFLIEDLEAKLNQKLHLSYPPENLMQ